jgi:integrase
MSRGLRRVLLEARDARLLAAYLKGESDITNELVFPSSDGGILDPDNLYHRLFIPALTKAGIRKIRLHDLRHTFGSLLLQQGASRTYVHPSNLQSIRTGTLFPGRMSPSSIVLTRNRRKRKRRRNHPQPPRNHAKMPRPRFLWMLLI